jgi:hypothetical protein
VRTGFLRAGAAVAAAAGLLATAGTAAAYHDATNIVSNCLKAHPPYIAKVTPTSAKVSYEYHDDCWYPAKTWLVVKQGNHTWRADEGRTEGSGNGWRTRSVDLHNLARNAKFEVKSAIEYIGADGESSGTWFETAYRPATDVWFRALASRAPYDRSGTVHLEFQARSFPQARGSELWPYGQINVEVFTTVNGRAMDPVALKLEYCHQLCEWREDLNGFDPGMHVRMQVKIANSTYAPAFADATLHSKWLEFTIGPGSDRSATGTT